MRCHSRAAGSAGRDLLPPRHRPQDDDALSAKSLLSVPLLFTRHDPHVRAASVSSGGYPPPTRVSGLIRYNQHLVLISPRAMKCSSRKTLFAAGLLFAVFGLVVRASGGTPPYDLDVVAHRTPPSIDQYTEVKVPLEVRNAGTRTWTLDTFRISYHWFSQDGKAVVWDGARTPFQRPVAPGETVQLIATLAAPPESGSLRLQWDVVEESVAWVSAHDPTPPPLVPVTVVAKPPRHAFSVLAGGNVRLMRAAGTRRVRVVLRNDGREPWGDGKPIHVSYHWSGRNAPESLYEGVRTPLAHGRNPGETIETSVDLQAPARPGLYRLQWDMVHEGVVWFSQNDPTPEVPFTVLILPAHPPASFAFFFSLLCAAFTFAAVRGRWISSLLVGAAGIADVLAAGVALAVKQSAPLEAAGVGYEAGAIGIMISGVAAVSILLALLPRVARPWAAVAINAAASFAVLADVLHFRFFSDVISIVRLRAAGQLPELHASIAALATPGDAWLLVDLLPAIAIAILVPRLRERVTTRPARLLALCLVPLLIPGIVMLVQLRGARDARLSQLFRNVFVVQEMGILNYHVFDAVSHAARSRELPAGRVRKIEAWLRATAPRRAGTAPWFGAARGRNLVMIQVESMQNFVLGLRIDGREVTPNLNRWLATEAVWFSGCTDQTAQGRTSDGELLSQISLHPSREGSAAFRYGDNHNEGIATVLSARGYATLSAVPFEPSFWNRLVTLPAYGYRINLDVDDFVPGPIVGWGLNDRDFLRQAVPRLASLDRPFAALLITLSNHHPFDSFPAELKTTPMGRHEGTPLGNYLHTMHLFDRAFGDFLEAMARTALLDDTVIAIWGDHASGLAWEPALAGVAGEDYSQLGFYRVDEVPFIVRLPGGTLRGERTLRCGLSDVAPTLLALLGVDPASFAFVGRNLLGDPGDGPVVRSYGAWFFREVLYRPLGATFKQGICYDTESLQRVDLERCRTGSILAREQLAISRDIVEHDLQRELSQRLSK